MDPATLEPPTTPTTPPADTTPPAAAAPDNEPSAFDRFDAEIPEFDTPAAAAPAAKPAAAAPSTPPAKPAAAAPAAKKDAPAAPPPAAAAAPQPDQMPSFKTNRELREWAQTQHKTARTLEAEKSKLENRLKELESAAPRTQADQTALTSQINDLQKRVNEYEQVIRLKDYEKSEEFQTQYQKPYSAAVKAAYFEVKELIVTEPTGEQDAEGKPVMRERPATEKDFDEIYNLPTGLAGRKARQMFGDDAATVLAHRNSVRALAMKAHEAVNDYKSKADTIEKERTQRETTERSQRDQFWRKATDAIANDPKGQAYWGKKTDDPEWNERLQKGFETAHFLFSEQHSKMPVEERIVFDAKMLHRIASWTPMAYQINKQQQEIQRLNEEIGRLRGSRPGAPEQTAPAAEGAERGTADEEFDKRVTG